MFTHKYETYSTNTLNISLLSDGISVLNAHITHYILIKERNSNCLKHHETLLSSPITEFQINYID